MRNWIHKLQTIFFLLSTFVACLSSAANITIEEIFVDPVNGLDNRAMQRSGSKATPFKTIKFAINYAEQEFNSGVVEADKVQYTIQLRGATYKETLTRKGLRGTINRPITIQAYQNERVNFDGSIDISGGWNSIGGNIYSKVLTEDVWQLFIEQDGQWQQKTNARWPNARFGKKRGAVASVYNRDSWAHANKTGNKVGLMVDDSLADDDINSIDLTGATVVANVGNFNSWTRKIVKHSPGAIQFKYNKTPSIWKSQKHYYYFVENTLALLDNDDEWFYDPLQKTAYLYSSNGTPTQKIRAKNRAYSVSVGGWEHVTLRNVNFFASTLRCMKCENFTLENANFEYGGSSRRALGQTNEKSEILFVSSKIRGPNHKSNITLRNIKVENVDGQGFLIRGNGTVVENSSFKNIDWAATESYAPSAALVLAGNFSRFSFNTVDYAGSSETLASSGATPGGRGKYTGPLGGRMTVEYNEFSNAGYAQSDGAMIQLRIAAQNGSIIRYNWLHDAPKYGIRFDAPIPATFYGSDAIAHHNVIWNAKGMMIKGENQRVYHNTIFNTIEPKRSDLILLDDANVAGVIGGANRGSIVKNNAADVISSQRTSIEAVLSWVNYGHNFNANKQNMTLASQLANIDNHDFRPMKNSLLNIGEAINDDYLTKKEGQTFAYTGAYRQGQSEYWIPGRQLKHATHPIPATGSRFVSTQIDLIWRKAYQAISYQIYRGISADSMFMVKELSGNVFNLVTLAPNTTYFWRIDALRRDGSVVTGKIWEFSTAPRSLSDLSDRSDKK